MSKRVSYFSSPACFLVPSCEKWLSDGLSFWLFSGSPEIFHFGNRCHSLSLQSYILLFFNSSYLISEKPSTPLSVLSLTLRLSFLVFLWLIQLGWILQFAFSMTPLRSASLLEQCTHPEENRESPCFNFMDASKVRDSLLDCLSSNLLKINPCLESL